jgi:hypothetical protein
MCKVGFPQAVEACPSKVNSNRSTTAQANPLFFRLYSSYNTHVCFRRLRLAVFRAVWIQNLNGIILKNLGLDDYSCNDCACAGMSVPDYCGSVAER